MIDTDKYREFAHGLELAPSNAIFELSDEVDRLDAILRQVHYKARCHEPGWQIAMFLADVRAGRVEVEPEWSSR